MRRDLLTPFEWRVECPRPGSGKMRESFVGSPKFVPQKLIFDRHGDTIKCGELVRRTVEHTLGTRSIVAADVEDQRVTQFAKVFDCLDDTADLVVGVGEIRAVHVSLPDKEF